MTAQDLKNYRSKAGITARELAEKIGVSTRTVESWEQPSRQRTVPKWAQLKIEELSHQDILKIPMTAERRKKLEKIAKDKGMSPSAFIEKFLDTILVAVLGFSILHAFRSPTNWSGKALLETGKASLAFVKSTIHAK